MKGVIFNIQRISHVDGPGVRTTVFFKGCNLKCAWCHNPESQSFKKQLLVYKNKCKGCGRCREVCPTDFAGCSACGRCVASCLYDAREICGCEISVEEVFDEIIKDRVFYETSGGGVTFSGGECMLQIDFLSEILKKCHENNIHTAVDTAGSVKWENFEKIIPYTDLFLYDVKSMNPEVHEKYTGVGNGLILENLSKLLKFAKVWVRVPVVTGVNDSVEEMAALKDFYQKYGYPEKTELLKYHAYGENKYLALNNEFQKFISPTEENINKLYAALENKIAPH